MSEVLTLNEADIAKINQALLLIWSITKHRLRNITVADNVANVSYGKRFDRLTVRLEDTHYEQVHIINI